MSVCYNLILIYKNANLLKMSSTEFALSVSLELDVNFQKTCNKPLEF